MSNIDKQALITKIKKQTESFDTVVLREDEANVLLDELEAARAREAIESDLALNWQIRCKYAEAKLEAAEKLNAELNIANSTLVAKIEPMDRRIAELESFIKSSCYVYDGNGHDISDAYIPAHESPLAPFLSGNIKGSE